MTRAQRRHQREKRIKVWERRMLRRDYIEMFPGGVPRFSMDLTMDQARERALKVARVRARTPDVLGACWCCHQRRKQEGPKPQERRQAMRADDAA